MLFIGREMLPIRLNNQECLGIGTPESGIAWKNPNCDHAHTLMQKNDDNLAVTISQISIIGIGGIAIAILLFIGILSLPVALFLILALAIASFFIGKDMVEKIKKIIDDYDNFLKNTFNILSKIANFSLDILGILIILTITYIIYEVKK